MLKLVDTRSLWIKARFDQGRSSGLVPGLQASIVLRAHAGKTLASQVARVELQGDSVTEERIAQITFTSLPVGFTMASMILKQALGLGLIGFIVGKTAATICAERYQYERGTRRGGRFDWPVGLHATALGLFFRPRT